MKEGFLKIWMCDMAWFAIANHLPLFTDGLGIECEMLVVD